MPSTARCSWASSHTTSRPPPPQVRPHPHPHPCPHPHPHPYPHPRPHRILTHHLSAAASAEGVGASGSETDEFNAFEVGWKLFDRDGKGHIDAADLRRVCLEMGYKVSERDIENMLTVMSPTVATQAHLPRRPSADGPRSRTATDVSDEEEPLEDVLSSAKISFDRYKTTMQSSFMRSFERGAYIFERGDPVDHFYVITRGKCEVLLPASEAKGKLTDYAERLRSTPSKRGAPRRPSVSSPPDAARREPDAARREPPASPGAAGDASQLGDSTADSAARRGGEEYVVIATLGPGDFFGETGPQP